jgi:hypothetical protein
VAEAAAQTITWILLAKAVRLVAAAYGYSLKLAEADLMRWLGKGRIRWRGELRGRKRDTDPGEGSAEFWKAGPRGGPDVEMRGPLSESRMHRKTLASDAYRFVRLGERVRRPVPLSDYAFFRIEVAQEDLAELAKLPAAPAETAVPTPIVATAKASSTPMYASDWLPLEFETHPRRPDQKPGKYVDDVWERLKEDPTVRNVTRKAVWNLYNRWLKEQREAGR